jgi:hypothetical protein
MVKLFGLVKLSLLVQIFSLLLPLFGQLYVSASLAVTLITPGVPEQTAGASKVTIGYFLATISVVSLFLQLLPSVTSNINFVVAFNV